MSDNRYLPLWSRPHLALLFFGNFLQKRSSSYSLQTLKTLVEEKRNKEVIVVDELPYQVNKARLIESIAQLVRDKQIDGISEIRDESDREGMRVVIELKRDAMSDIILNNLFKQTQMQVTFGIIMLAIVNKEPKIFNLHSLL